MKKVLVLILALVMSFSLVACGGDKDENKQEQQNNESSLQQSEGEENTADSSQENKENATLFVGVWADGNTTLTVNDDGSCNLFIKKGSVMGEAQTDIRKDYVWEIDDNGNLLTIDEAEGGYNKWVRVEKDGQISLQMEGASGVLIFEN